MKQFYFFSKPLFLSLLFITLFSGQAFSQCGNVVENFNTDAGGFTGKDFPYNSNNGNLEASNFTAGQGLTTNTPTYTLANNATNINFGFTIAGIVKVASYTVTVVYYNNGVLTTSPYPSGPISYGTSYNACQSISIPTGLNFGDPYKLQITLTAAASGDGTSNTITFDDFRTTASNSQIALPVTFVSVTAKRITTGTEISWNVADEKGVTRYEVEKSIDARTFATIGQVAAANKSAYSFVDAKSVSTDCYYRVKNVDVDGKFEYSPIVRVNAAGNSYSDHIRLYPSPAQSQVTVQHKEMSNAATITISTVDGKVLKVTKPNAGTSHTSVDLSGVASGVYVLRVTDKKGNTESAKFVKQ